MIPQRNQSPIILDESYDLTETVTLAFGSENHEGLLAQADLGAAFVSMSGYEKSPIPITDGEFT